MDDYMHEILDDELDSIMGDAEVYEEFEHMRETIHFDDRNFDGPVLETNDFVERVYKRVLDEFPDYEKQWKSATGKEDDGAFFTAYTVTFPSVGSAAARVVR